MRPIRAIVGDVNARLPLLLALCACGTPVGIKQADGDTGAAVSSGSFGGVRFEPGLLEFGNVAPDSSAIMTVTLTNAADDDAKLSNAFTNGDGFALHSDLSLPLTLSPDDSVDVEVSFSPTELSAYDGTLNIGVAGEVGYGEVALTGTGSNAGSGDDSGSPSGEGSLGFSPESISFGEAALSDLVWRTLELTNVGSGELLVTSISTSNPMVFQHEPEFSLPKLLRPSATATVRVGFSPSEMREYTGVLDVDTDSSSGGALIPLSGVGSDSSCGVCAPIMSVSTSSGGSDTLALSPPFGVGCTANGSVTIANSGDMTLDLTGVTLTNDLISACGTFAQSWSGPLSLEPGESSTIGVDYIATETCMDWAYPDFDQNVMRVSGSDPDNPEHTVSLEGSALFCG